MNKLLTFAALAEGATGVLLFAYPPIMVRLLTTANISGAGIVMSRIAGAVLIGFGVACWPGDSVRQQFFGMLTYNVLAAAYLILVGLSGSAGVMLWPAVVYHVGMTLLLLWVRSSPLRRRSQTSNRS
jgi:hypothetical protein